MIAFSLFGVIIVSIMKDFKRDIIYCDCCGKQILKDDYKYSILLDINTYACKDCKGNALLRFQYDLDKDND